MSDAEFMVDVQAMLSQYGDALVQDAKNSRVVLARLGERTDLLARCMRLLKGGALAAGLVADHEIQNTSPAQLLDLIEARLPGGLSAVT